MTLFITPLIDMKSVSNVCFTCNRTYNNILQNYKGPTLEASSVGVALESRQTSADGAMVLHVALGIGSTVAGDDALGVEARSVTRALTVSTATHAYWEVHCGQGRRRSAWAKRDS